MNLSDEENKYLLSLIKKEKIVEAVKFVREKMNISLSEAKKYVDMKRIDENTIYLENDNVTPEDDEDYIFYLLKEKKGLEAITFLHKERGISLEEAKNYVDKKVFELSEKTLYKGRTYIIDKKINTLIHNLNKQRKIKKIIFYILLIFIVILLILLSFLNKIPFNQRVFLVFPIIFFFLLLIIWFVSTLDIYFSEKRMNKIKELELSNEFEIKSLRKNGTLFFYIVILIVSIFRLSTYPNILLSILSRELTYKSAFDIILLIGLIIFYFYNFFKDLKNRKYSLNINGKTIKIFYENKEVNTIKTDEINYVEFYSTSSRIKEWNPTLRIFNNEKKMLVEMTIKREDYHILTMYFTNYNLLIQDKFNEI